MGIDGIHILFEVDTDDAVLKFKMAQQEILMLAHRNGDHPYGSMIPDCPLCQLGR